MWSVRDLSVYNPVIMASKYQELNTEQIGEQQKGILRVRVQQEKNIAAICCKLFCHTVNTFFELNEHLDYELEWIGHEIFENF